MTMRLASRQRRRAFPVDKPISRVALWLLVCLTCLTARAQTSYAAKSTAFRIAGRVLNAITGEPVRHATVSILEEEGDRTVATMQSDNEGHFAFDHLSAGKYPLTASKRGFRTAFFDEHDDYSTSIVIGSEVNSSLDVENLSLLLAPGAVLRGVITGDGGDPVESANVLLFHRLKTGPGNRIVQSDATTTDDSGSYEFSDIPPGEYFVAVSATPWYAMHDHPNWARTSAAEIPASLDVAYPITYYDSSIDESSATPIVLAEGSHENADINLHAVPAIHLKIAAPLRSGKGIVRPEIRQMVFGTQVAAESAGFLEAVRTGDVDFNGIAPGHYQITQGDPPRIAELDATSSQEVDPAIGTPAVSVIGVLRSATNSPLPDGLVVLLQPSDSGNSQNQLQTAIHNGQFRFDAVAPGTWSLSIAGSAQPMPVIATTVSGATSPGGQISVKDHPIQLLATVSSSLARINGVARKDGKGFAGAMIVLVPSQSSDFQALIRRDQSDSDGSFSLRDVPAGRYTVIALEDGWKLDWNDRSLLSRYLPAGASVTITGNSSGTVRLVDSVSVQPR